MKEYPIAQMYADSRVSKIFHDANEIMKKSLGVHFNMKCT